MPNERKAPNPMINRAFFSHKRYNVMPRIMKKTTRIFSVAVRERFTCHGEKAKMSVATNARSVLRLFWRKIKRTMKKNRRMVSEPKNAEGNRTAYDVSPKRAMGGMAAYAYPAGL